MKPERDRCPTCGSPKWRGTRCPEGCDSPEPREVERTGGGVEGHALQGRSGAQCGQSGQERPAASIPEPVSRPARQPSELREEEMPRQSAEPNEPASEEGLLIAGGSRSRNPAHQRGDTADAPDQMQPGARLRDGRLFANGGARIPAANAQREDEREAGMGGGSGDARHAQVDGERAKSVAGTDEPARHPSDPPDADSSSGRTHEFIDAGFDTCQRCGDPRSGPDHVTEAGDAGSSPASATEREFEEAMNALCRHECQHMGECDELEDVYEAHGRATANAYDRGFKDASALAANSVRQAKEQTWREANHLTPSGLPFFLRWISDRFVCVYGESENIDFVRSLRHMAEEFERRATLKEPK